MIQINDLQTANEMLRILMIRHLRHLLKDQPDEEEIEAAYVALRSDVEIVRRLKGARHEG